MYLTSKDVKNIDNYCINSLGIPELLLMENAAIKVANNIEDRYKNIVIICGMGNNGGDGLAAGRHLLCEGKSVQFYIIGSEDKMSNSSKVHLNILRKLKAHVEFVTNNNLCGLKNIIKESDIIIDCIFGIGLSREVTGIYQNVINLINDSAKHVLSVDVPSGLDANDEKIYGCCVKANKTVTFIGEKVSFNTSIAKQFLGKVIVEQISVPLDIVKYVKESI